MQDIPLPGTNMGLQTYSERQLRTDVAYGFSVEKEGMVDLGRGVGSASVGA